MCCRSAKWKREVVQDHKFDFVDVREYRVTGFFTRLRYAFVYIFLIKSVLVYLSDIYTVVAMLANNYWAGNILSESDSSNTIKVPFTIGKWIFLGCIIFSFLLLAWESRKARMIIRSRDISYAFTNIMANNYYSLKSYDHFCFFSQINNSKKKKDEFAFFVFFTFKGWKRLLLADAPRQVINALTLYSFGKAFNFTTDLSKYYNNEDGSFSFIRAGILCTMIFTVVVWAGSAILLTVAAIMYVPLLCYIQGNLKEYCCHKIDKRIEELMKRKTKKRLAREAEFAKREAAGDYRHLQDKKGRFKDGQAPLPQPTLPTIDLKDDELYGEGKSEIGSMNKRANSQKSAGTMGYGYGYPPAPSLSDLSYGGGKGYNDPYGQYPRYQLSDGAPQDSQHSLASYGQPYPYPSQTSLNMLNNDSMVSFNDDKMSIRSRDPLVARGNSRSGGGDIGDTSQLSLNEAPSYHTHPDEDNYGYAQSIGGGVNNANPSNTYGAYEPRTRSPPHHQQQQRHYDPDPQHPYTDPPYVLDDLDFDNDPYAHQQQQQQQYDPAYAYQQQPSGQGSDQYPPYIQQYRTESPHQQSYQQHDDRSRDLAPASHHDIQQRYQQQSQPHQQQGNPTARGVSVAGRSDVTTMYFMDDRDRQSMADSHMGAFDLDDYARQSVIPPSLRGSTVWGGANAGTGSGHGNHQSYALQRRGSNLEYLQEENEEDLREDDDASRHRNGPNKSHQQDWRR